jgi:hypothetical protein
MAITINGSGITSSEIADGSISAADLDVGQLGGRRNLIINGGFDVWQRGTSFSSIGNMQYCADRMVYSRANQVDVARVDCSLDGFKYAARQTNVSAGSCTHYHKVENTGQFYAGQTLTLSFWARASEAMDQRSFRCYSASGYVTGYDIIYLTTDWQYFTVTKTIASTWTGSEPSLDVQVLTGNSSLSAGSWIEITGVQLEVGSVATPFEHRSYGEELALCQRYYEVSGSESRYSMNAASTGISHYFTEGFNVAKRASPTITINQNYNDNLTIGISSAATTIQHAGFAATPTTADTRALAEYEWIADAEL